MFLRTCVRACVRAHRRLVSVVHFYECVCPCVYACVFASVSVRGVHLLVYICVDLRVRACTPDGLCMSDIVRACLSFYSSLTPSLVDVD